MGILFKKNYFKAISTPFKLINFEIFSKIFEEIFTANFDKFIIPIEFFHE